jgi:hypothetical protein
MTRLHWPFQLGYFETSCAQRSVSVTQNAAASAIEAMEFRKFMTVLRVIVTCRDEAKSMRFEPQKSIVVGKVMPADGVRAAARKRDFGTSCWQL